MYGDANKPIPAVPLSFIIEVAPANMALNEIVLFKKTNNGTGSPIMKTARHTSRQTPLFVEMRRYKAPSCHFLDVQYSNYQASIVFRILGQLLD